MSNEHNFKEGELFYAADNKVYQYVNEIIGSELVCTIRDDGHPFTSNASKKIGNLMATAPKLYAEVESDIDLLKVLRNYCRVGSDDYRACCIKIESKRALLSEARGEHE